MGVMHDCVGREKIQLRGVGGIKPTLKLNPSSKSLL